MKKIILILAAVAAIAAVAWFGFIKKPSSGLPEQAPEAQSGFGGSLYDKVTNENPVAKLPETNPFTTNTNPFSGTYKNPFGQ